MIVSTCVVLFANHSFHVRYGCYCRAVCLLVCFFVCLFVHVCMSIICFACDSFLGR